MQYTYRDAVRYIDETPKFTAKNDPANTRELMRRLGDPQECFLVIHVAGTNGKGSVCAFMAAALQAAGLRTGLFTSPHLVRINERFQINRKEISDTAFAGAFARVRAVIDDMLSDGWSHPAYFEILFAMGMLLFEEEKVEILVMETGLGGRLDATNIVRKPLCCVITSVSLDHTAILGDTIELIAGEKAGIIKEDVPVIYDDSDEKASRVICDKARQIHAPAIPVHPRMLRILSRSADGIRYVLTSTQFASLQVFVPFAADYQVINSALALTALRVIDPEGRIPDGTLADAVSGTRWSGRMQRVAEGIIFDGAHNRDGIRQLTKTISRTAREREVALLFSAVSDKDYPEMIRALCSRIRYAYIVVTQIEGSRRVNAQKLAACFAACTDAPVFAVPDPAEAFRVARSKKTPKQVLFCAGSLYLIGELEKELIQS